MEKREEPILVIQQKYNYMYEILEKSGVTIFLVLLFSYPAFKAHVLMEYFICLSIYVIYLISSNIYRKRKQQSISIEFYQQSLKILKKRKKETDEIFYSQIKSIKYGQLILQQFFKLGDLYIEIKDRSWLRNKIHIYGVENITEIYQEVMRITKQN